MSFMLWTSFVNENVFTKFLDWFDGLSSAKLIYVLPVTITFDLLLASVIIGGILTAVGKNTWSFFSYKDNNVKYDVITLITSIICSLFILMADYVGYHSSYWCWIFIAPIGFLLMGSVFLLPAHTFKRKSKTPAAINI